MRFSSTWIQGLVVGVAATGLLAAMSLTSSAGIISSSSSGACIPPADAAFIIGYQYEYLFEGTGLAGDPGDCRDVCKKAFSSCRDAVKRSKKCLNKFAKEQNRVLRQACESGEFRDSVGAGDKGECKDGANDLRTGITGFGKDSFEAAQEICENFEADCEATCEDGLTPPM